MPLSTLGIALGVGFTVLAILMHFSKGSGWEPAQDLADEIMERRAATLPETDFPEPMNRAPGGGAAAAGAVAAGGEAGELEEGGEAAGAEAEEGPWSLADEDADSFEVEFAKEGATIDVAENETLLVAGEDEGWDLPYACREGQCISCSGRITDGAADDYVVHQDQEMLGQEERDEGYVLTCCAYPQDDFTLETRESP